MPATYEPIATFSPSGVSAVTFSSIPGTYTDLRIVATVSSNVINSITIQYNGNAGSLYSQTNLYGNGTSALTGWGNNQTSLYYSFATNTYTSTPQLFTLDVFSYAGSTFKTALLTTAADNNGSGLIDYEIGMWRSTAAITSISLTLGASRTFNTGNVITLYGIKAA